jgi:hypothetical protein
MPNDGNTRFEDAARLTVELVDDECMPDELSEALMETLLEMANRIELSQLTRINIWHRETVCTNHAFATGTRENDIVILFDKIACSIMRPGI